MKKVQLNNHVDTKTMVSRFTKTGKVTQCREAGNTMVRKDFKTPKRSRYYAEQI